MFKNFTCLFILLLGVVTMAEGQIRTPAPSPSASFTQTVGMTTVSAEYSRPSMNGRAIFGDLVPFDQVWRTGANQISKISFSEDVTIEGNALTKGAYGILTKPGKMSWDVHFYNYDGGNWSAYTEREPALVVTVTPVKLPMQVQSFMISVDELTANGATLEIIWSDVLVPIKLGVHTDEAVMASINKVMGGPTPSDYFNAGTYYHTSGKDLKKALEYVQMATIGDSPKFWQVRREALILADLGRKAEAITAAKKSIELAKAAGNDDYVRMNEKSLKAWSM